MNEGLVGLGAKSRIVKGLKRGGIPKGLFINDVITFGGYPDPLPPPCHHVILNRLCRAAGATKTDEFSEEFQRRGGGAVFSIQKFMLHIDL